LEETKPNLLKKIQAAVKNNDAKVEEGLSNTTSTLLSLLDKSINEAKSAKKQVQRSTDTEKAVKSINEEFESAKGAWLKLIPESFKPIWMGLNEGQRQAIERQASVRITNLQSKEQVQRFWESRDFSSIVAANGKADDSKKTGLAIVNEAVAEQATTERKKLANLSVFLRVKF